MPPSGSYSTADFFVARLSLLTARTPLPTVPRGLTSTEELHAFLLAVGSDPLLREVIEVSSPALAGCLDKVLAGAEVKAARLRGATLSAARYLARMTRRPTPFGLLAGVAASGFGPSTTVRIGTEWHKQVRPDMEWFNRVVRAVETNPAVLTRLRLVRNDLAFRRADRLIVPNLSGIDDVPATVDQEFSIRHTSAVAVVLRTCERAPVGYQDLVDALVGEFPGADPVEAAGMIGQLVERGFLLTDLRPAPSCTDPLAHLLAALRPVPAAALPPGLVAELTRAEESLHAYQDAPIGAGRSALRAAVTALRACHQESRSFMQVDVAADASITLPTGLRAELARAFEVAWRLAPAAKAPIDVLRNYRAEFVERYGHGVVVPIKELLDPQTGLGAPASYVVPPSGRKLTGPQEPAADRDLILIGLAQRAAAHGERELVIDAELEARLDQHRDLPTSYYEACVEVFAASTDALDAGDYRLSVNENGFSKPGAYFGRFLPLLPEFTERVAGLADRVIGTVAGVPAQLMSSTTRFRLSNVAQVPQLTERVISVGMFDDRSMPGVYSLDDLAIGAETDRMYVVCAESGEELVPMPFHALSPLVSVPNAVRLLHEIGQSRTAPWVTWHWGDAEQLPYLPRIRIGRTVLRCARWRPDPELLDRSLDFTQWRTHWQRWRSDWTMPTTVYAANQDHRLRLELDSELALELLHGELRKHPDTVLQEDLLESFGSNDWADGHAVEIAVPMLPARPQPVAAPTRPLTVGGVGAERAHQPGNEWLFAKVYATPARQQELLARQVPELLERIDGIDRWFFIRYEDDGGAHLRLRLHGEPGVLTGRVLPMLHEWSAGLSDAGQTNRLVLDTYRPEYGRYGGPELIEPAEAAFHADSRSVLCQLRLRAADELDLPTEVLTAANVLDIAQAFDPLGWRQLLLATYPKNSHHEFFRRHREQALALLDTEGEWTALRAIAGGAELVDSWKARGSAVTDYGAALRERVAAGRLSSTVPMFGGLLHMHHNRHTGIDRELESRSYAVARGVVQIHADRERHFAQ